MKKKVTGDFLEEIVLQAEKIIKKCNAFFFEHLRYELFRYVKRTKWT